MELSQSVIDHIRFKAKNIRYGEITIILNESSDRVDIVSQERVRFAPTEGEAPAGRTVRRSFHKGQERHG